MLLLLNLEEKMYVVLVVSKRVIFKTVLIFIEGNPPHVFFKITES